MVTEEPMATPTDADILTLTQWLSPAYPVGGFAYSHGLEWAIDSGDIRSAADTAEWISDILSHGSGWNDCLFLAAAYNAADGSELAEIDQTTRAFCASAERLKESQLLGEAFCQVTGHVWAIRLQALTYPVAVGRAARLHGLPLELTAKMYAQSFMSNLVACATRLVPFGQTEAQILIRALTPDCAETARLALDASLDDLTSTAFLSDIASMQHETQYSRIFRT